LVHKITKAAENVVMVASLMQEQQHQR